MRPRRIPANALLADPATLLAVWYQANAEATPLRHGRGTSTADSSATAEAASSAFIGASANQSMCGRGII